MTLPASGHHALKGLTRPIGLIDLGTSKVGCLIVRGTGGDARGELPRVLGFGQHQARGVKAGVLVDLDAAEGAVRSAVADAEAMAGVTIGEVVVAVACGRVGSEQFTARVQPASGVVRRADVERLMSGAAAYATRDGRALIHLGWLDHSLDGAGGVVDPVGMAGQSLGADVHAATVDEAPLRNLMLLIARCHLAVIGLVPAPLAAALAVTTPDERAVGVTCLDLGAGVTGVAAFHHGRLVLADAIAVGGHLLTYDIARALDVPLAAAERIKSLYGTLVPASSDEMEIVTFRPIGADGAGRHQTTRGELNRLVAPRMDSLLALVRERLPAVTSSGPEPGRLVVTGGASQIVGLAGFAARALGRSVRLAQPVGGAGAPPGLRGPAWSTLVGLRSALARDVHSVTAPQSLSPDGYIARVGRWLRESF